MDPSKLRVGGWTAGTGLPLHLEDLGRRELGKQIHSLSTANRLSSRHCLHVLHPVLHFEAVYSEFPLGMWAGLREVNNLLEVTQLLSEEQRLIQFLGCGTPGPVGVPRKNQLCPERFFTCACLVTSSPRGETSW